MTDLRSAAVREAGARAMWYCESIVAAKDGDEYWTNRMSDLDKAIWYEKWNRVAFLLAPIIQQETVREQLRAGNANEEAEE